MGSDKKKFFTGAATDRVDGILKVTGAAKYAAEYDIPGLVYGVLVSSTIARGAITSLDVREAEAAPGVIAVISHLNCPRVPGYSVGKDPGKPPTKGDGLRVFSSNHVFFSGQPIALVVADSFERATYAASRVKAKYSQQDHHTELLANRKAGYMPKNDQNYERGSLDLLHKAPVKIDHEYVLPREVHNPMELHSIIAVWDGDNRVTVYDKTQGVKSTQRSIMEAFKLREENVSVISSFVGGAFGSALRTWPHEIAALIGAKKTGRPLKLVLTRDQMFTMVGYRPQAWQRVMLGASRDGKLAGIYHEAVAETSSYEEFPPSRSERRRA